MNNTKKSVDVLPIKLISYLVSVSIWDSNPCLLLWVNDGDRTHSLQGHDLTIYPIELYTPYIKWGENGDSNPNQQGHNLPCYHYTILTCAEGVGFEPDTSFTTNNVQNCLRYPESFG